MSIECIVICVIYESLNKIIKEITLYNDNHLFDHKMPFG